MSAFVLFFLLMLPKTVHAVCKLDDVPSAGVSGFQEAVLSVSDIDAASETWRSVGGYDVLCDGPVEAGLAAFWGLPEDTPMHEVLLRKGSGHRGFVRLIQIHGLPQVQIRSSGMPWDHGGFFDLYVYVSNVDAVFEQLRDRGWQGYTDPVHYTLDPFDIDEAIVRGPDGEVLVLMQRNAPPYNKAVAGSESGMGWPFNTALIVSDYMANEKFFADVLGWNVHLSGRSITPEPGYNPMGIPANLASSSGRRFAAFAPHETDRNGSIQILISEGLTGRDFKDQAEPPNLGILTMRVPVNDVRALERDVEASGYSVHRPVEALNLPPYGAVEIMALKAPNGARIEFFTQQ